MSNYYTSTWPGSPFVQRPVVVRKDERLLGQQLAVAVVRFLKERPASG